jgi:integrase/recombinase XerC
MIISTDAFRDYLEKEKKYSLHTVSGYLKDLKISLYNEIHFFKNTIDHVIILKLELGLCRLLMQEYLMFP